MRITPCPLTPGCHQLLLYRDITHDHGVDPLSSSAVLAQQSAVAATSFADTSIQKSGQIWKHSMHPMQFVSVSTNMGTQPSLFVPLRQAKTSTGADIETETAGFAHVFTDDDIPLASVLGELLLFGLEQRHRPLATASRAWTASRTEAIFTRTNKRSSYLHRHVIA